MAQPLTDNVTADSSENDHIKITKDPLNIDEAVRLVTHPSCGAIATFLGRFFNSTTHYSRN